MHPVGLEPTTFRVIKPEPLPAEVRVHCSRRESDHAPPTLFKGRRPTTGLHERAISTSFAWPSGRRATGLRTPCNTAPR